MTINAALGKTSPVLSNLFKNLLLFDDTPSSSNAGFAHVQNNAIKIYKGSNVEAQQSFFNNGNRDNNKDKYGSFREAFSMYDFPTNINVALAANDGRKTSNTRHVAPYYMGGNAFGKSIIMVYDGIITDWKNSIKKLNIHGLIDSEAEALGHSILNNKFQKFVERSCNRLAVMWVESTDLSTLYCYVKGSFGQQSHPLYYVRTPQGYLLSSNPRGLYHTQAMTITPKNPEDRIPKQVSVDELVAFNIHSGQLIVNKKQEINNRVYTRDVVQKLSNQTIDFANSISKVSGNKLRGTMYLSKVTGAPISTRYDYDPEDGEFLDYSNHLFDSSGNQVFPDGNGNYYRVEGTEFFKVKNSKIYNAYFYNGILIKNKHQFEKLVRENGSNCRDIEILLQYSEYPLTPYQFNKAQLEVQQNNELGNYIYYAPSIDEEAEIKFTGEIYPLFTNKKYVFQDGFFIKVSHNPKINMNTKFIIDEV